MTKSKVVQKSPVKVPETLPVDEHTSADVELSPVTVTGATDSVNVAAQDVMSSEVGLDGEVVDAVTGVAVPVLTPTQDLPSAEVGVVGDGVATVTAAAPDSQVDLVAPANSDSELSPASAEVITTLIDPPAEAPAASQVAQTKAAKVTESTKMDVATEIYKQMKRVRGATRQDIIQRFVADADLTKAGASTYYQLIKTRLEK